ncbi:MAG: aldo/keto reductase [Devosia nanyangense]|uniref:Aldo/keto reductase n=1 Tax=Devosia nanyangense TaxID=1228055 RepID=A0A933L1W1_9HYPH|nr:aldo/keto reductase [Devosia nanyangense]
MPTNNAGAAIPQLGLGTWQLRGELCATIVSEALRLGYTHVDTAQGYANEEAVGEGLRTSGVGRERVFVTTKVQPQQMGDGDLQRSVTGSLKKLGIGQIDLLLLHWPNPAIPLADSIRALNEVKRRGLVRHLGLSNFTTWLLDEAWRLTTEPFAAEQIEFHPYIEQGKMVSALRRHGMSIIAYCPIALGRVIGDPVIEAIAAAHNRSAAQVTLRWIVQRGLVAIPRTSKIERLAQNLAVFDFSLTDAEMASMSALTRPGSRLVNEPQWVPEWD